MCQLNVYMIDKFVPGMDVKEIFNRHHHHNFENLNDEVVIKTYDDDFNYFEASNNRCDCGSLLGIIRDEKDKYSTYREYLEATDKSELLKLYKIKDHLLSPDYSEKLANCLTTRDNLFNKLNAFSKPLVDIDMEMAEIQMKAKPNLQEQVRLKQLFNERKAVQEKIEHSHDYILAKDIYENFAKENESLISSQNYMTEYKKDWWQENIDTAINMFEHKNHSHLNAEFNHIKSVLNDILKLTNEVKLFSFWQSDAKYENDYFNSLTEVKTTTLQDLKLEDLIFLDFKEVVTIKR